MRNIYFLLTFTLCCLLAGCSEDKDNPVEKQLKVISSNVSFNCEGGAGIIEVNSNTAIAATSTEEWCKVNIAGMTVNVAVEPNLKISSRTAMVIVTSGTEETRVPVYQQGDIFDTDLDDVDFMSEGGEKTFLVKSNWDIQIEGNDESWLTYTLEGDQLTFKATPLTEGGKYRKNEIKVKAGTNEIAVTFTQVNLTGDYSCFVSNGAAAKGTCVIEETDTPFLYKITPTGSYFDAPYYAKYRNGEFVIYFGQYLGEYGDGEYKYVYLCTYDAIGRLAWGNNLEYTAPIATVNTAGKMLLIFKDNGTWVGQKVDGFYYGLFNNLTTKGGTTKGGGVAAIVNLIWVKN